MRLSRTIIMLGIALEIGLLSSLSSAQNLIVVGADPKCKEIAASTTNQPHIVNGCSCIPKLQKHLLEMEEVGEVELNVSIDRQNRFVKASVVKTSGFRNLDRTGQKVVAQCQFRAGEREGQPINSSFHLIYGWKMNNNDGPDALAYFKQVE